MHQAGLQTVGDVVGQLAGVVGAGVVGAAVLDEGLLELGGEEALVGGDGQAFESVVVRAAGVGVVGFFFVASGGWVA